MPGGRVQGVVVVANSGGWEQRPFRNLKQTTFALLEQHAKTPLSASLLDVDLTHPFLLPNDLDLMA